MSRLSRLSKYLLISVPIVFVLACNLVTGPIDDVQNLAKTAEAIGTAMPLETIQAIASSMPLETLEALPSAFPDLGTDPQGTPVAEWNGIPIMPQATAGQELDSSNYSFKFPGTVKDASDFYNDALGKLGWSPLVSIPGDEEIAVLSYQKDSASLIITITFADGSTVVHLSLP